MAKDKMLDTWLEYMKHLYSDAPEEEFDDEYNIEWPPILKTGVQNDLKHTKSRINLGPNDNHNLKWWIP